MSAATKDAEAASTGASTSEATPPGAAESSAAVPVSKRGAIYTMTALEGLDAAELVKAAFAKKLIGAVTPRRLEVAAPDGPSTAGGKRARQTIRLVPATGDGAPVMCGYLDVARKLAEVRHYRTVAQQYQERFGKTFDVTASEYAGLCRDLEATLAPFRYTFSYEPEAEAENLEGKRVKLSSQPAAPTARTLNVIVATLVVLILAGVLVAMALR